MAGMTPTLVTSAMTSQQKLDAAVALQQLFVNFVNNRTGDKANIHPQARLYGGRIATGVKGTRFALPDIGMGIPWGAIKDFVVGSDERPDGSISERVLRSSYQTPNGPRIWFADCAKVGMLCGTTTATIPNLSSTVTKTINFTTAVAPELHYPLPAGWTAPRTLVYGMAFPAYDGVTHWVRGTELATIEMDASTSDTIAFNLHDRTDSTGAAYTTGNRTLKFHWMAWMKYS